MGLTWRTMHLGSTLLPHPPGLRSRPASVRA